MFFYLWNSCKVDGIDTKSHIFLSCLALTGVIKRSLQASLEIKLDIPPFDIFIKNIVRLKESKKVRHEHVGYGTLLRAVIDSNFVEN